METHSPVSRLTTFTLIPNRSRLPYTHSPYISLYSTIHGFAFVKYMHVTPPTCILFSISIALWMVVHFIVAAILSCYLVSPTRFFRWLPRRRIAQHHLGGEITSISRRKCSFLDRFIYHWGSRIPRQKRLLSLRSGERFRIVLASHLQTPLVRFLSSVDRKRPQQRSS